MIQTEPNRSQFHSCARDCSRNYCRALLLTLILALACTGIPGSVWAEASGSDADFEGWEETAGLQLAVGDSLDILGRIFDASDYQHTLVVPGGGEMAYLLALKAQTVQQLTKDSLQWDPMDRPMPSDETGEEIGFFTNDEGVIVFDSDLFTLQVQPEPPLVGELSLEEMRSAKPDYFHAAEKYEPDPRAIAAIQSIQEKTEILVFFGTWCSYCKRAVPPLLKTLELAGNGLVTARFYAVSEDQSEPGEPLAKFDVGPTPTIIVLQGGEERGRIEEEAIVSIEADLVGILGVR